MENTVKKHRKPNLIVSLIAVVVLILFLAINIFKFKGLLLGTYSNHYILFIAAAVAFGIGLVHKVPTRDVFYEVFQNLKSVAAPVFILILVGALTGTWLVSGVIPAMLYYGLQLVNPTIFLPTCVLVSAIVSIATGSSWTTSATIGIAFVGIGTALGFESGMIAGAVISGAYFGDKMSPLSDTTNLAPAMAGTDLFTHIRYMSLTTIPTFLLTLIFFTILSFFHSTTGVVDVTILLKDIVATFQISPLLFLVPGLVVGLMLLKTKPLLALSSGVVFALLFAVFFQGELLSKLPFPTLEVLTKAVFSNLEIPTKSEILNSLFRSDGVLGMVWTILLILAAMVFGGVMDAIGALSRITESLLHIAHTTFGLFASTVFSCLGLNIVASDQYLAIVVPGKMFKKAYEDKGLAPENLSRTLEDSGTVTSVLVPWNTCGAYQSKVLLGEVGDLSFIPYAFFNYLSPFTTLIFAAFKIKIQQQANKN
jgi:NhaC family Na+:H+ antiporter